MDGDRKVLGKRKRREATADFQRGPTDVKTLLASSIWKMSEQDRNLVLAQMHDWAIKYKGKKLFVNSHVELSTQGLSVIGRGIFVSATSWGDDCFDVPQTLSFG